MSAAALTGLTGLTGSPDATAGGAEPVLLATHLVAQPAQLVQSVDWLAIAPPTVVAVAAVVVLVAGLVLMVFVPRGSGAGGAGRAGAGSGAGSFRA